MENSQAIVGVVGSSAKTDIELGEVDLRLLAGRGLEANLVSTLGRGRTDVAQEVGDGRVAAAIAEDLQFAEKPAAGEPGISRDAFAR